MKLKTFLLTFLTFLVFLYSGIVFILMVSLKNNISNIKDRALGEHFFIVSTYYNDLIRIQNRENKIDDIIIPLFDTYSLYYQTQPVFLSIYKDDILLKSMLPNNQYNLKIDINEDKRKVFYDSIENKEYLFIIGKVPKPFEYLTVAYCYDLTENIEQWNDMYKILFLIGFIISLLLGFILYIVLSYIFKPLSQIVIATERVSQGDYENKIIVKGNGELYKVANSFNHMVDEIKRNIYELSETLKQKQQFIDNFAHELRTPLTSIYGYAEYMQKAKLTESDKYESTEAIMEESQKLQDIAERLLKLALYRENKLEYEEINASTIINNTINSFKTKLEQKDIQLNIKVGKEIIKGDNILLNCLFSNIIDNAIKACNQNGIINIQTLQEDNNKISILIKDNGKGIPDDAIEHLTEAFYRVDKARDRIAGGAGIGLTLCKQIVDRHNAHLSFYSNDDEGTTVKITFTAS